MGYLYLKYFESMGPHTLGCLLKELILFFLFCFVFFFFLLLGYLLSPYVLKYSEYPRALVVILKLFASWGFLYLLRGMYIPKSWSGSLFLVVPDGFQLFFLVKFGV